MITCRRAIPILRMFDEAMRKQLNLSGHFGDGSPGAAVRIETTDLDVYAKLLRDKNYKHARPGCPQDQEWGCRELSIQDPSGNKLIFYANLPTP